MSKESSSQEAFESLLMWLDSDREQAGKRYEEIRQSLIKIFTWRGITEAEDLADETFNRVTRRLPDLVINYTGDPAMYFYSVANNLTKEYHRQKKRRVPLKGQRLATSPPADEPDTFEREYDCLNRCLQELEPDQRKLILEYYSKDKQAKIDHRKELARRLNLDVNALRVRMYRSRSKLERCIEDCLKAFDVKELN
jgi:RNA polymerase sigma factor (sigma-70 family)